MPDACCSVVGGGGQDSADCTLVQYSRLVVTCIIITGSAFLLSPLKVRCCFTECPGVFDAMRSLH